MSDLGDLEATVDHGSVVARTYAFLDRSERLQHTTDQVQAVVARTLGMPPTTLTVLLCVDKGSRDAREIAAQAGLDVRAVAATLTSLTIDGLVRRLGSVDLRPPTRGPVDWLVTDRGRGRLDQAEAIRIRVVGAFVARLTAAEVQLVERALDLINEGLLAELETGPTLTVR